MPQDRARHRVAAVIAASLVGLFVVVVGATSSQAVTVRVGAVATPTNQSSAGPADLSSAPQDATVAHELGGHLPTLAGLLVLAAFAISTVMLRSVVSATLRRATGRAPPAA